MLGEAWPEMTTGSGGGPHRSGLTPSGTGGRENVRHHREPPATTNH